MIFIEFMLNLGSFCQVQDKFKTSSTFFEIEFKFRDFVFRVGQKIEFSVFKFEFTAQVTIKIS